MVLALTDRQMGRIEKAMAAMDRHAAILDQASVGMALARNHTAMFDRCDS